METFTTDSIDAIEGNEIDKAKKTVEGWVPELSRHLKTTTAGTPFRLTSALHFIGRNISVPGWGTGGNDPARREGTWAEDELGGQG